MPTIPSSPRLEELERSWYQVRTPGATARTPINQVKMDYWKSVVGSGFKTYAAAEQEHVKYQIRQASATPSNTNYDSQLWRELVAALGGPVSPRMTENKRWFFQNVTT